MARDRVLQIRCSAAEMESLENQARGWGGPLSAYVRMVLFGPVAKVPAAKPTEAAIAAAVASDVKRLLRPKGATGALSRATCDHKPFKRKDGLTVCDICGVRL